MHKRRAFQIIRAIREDCTSLLVQLVLFSDVKALLGLLAQPSPGIGLYSA